MRQVSVSHQEGVSGVHQIDIVQTWCQSLVWTIQQKSQGIPCLVVSHWVPTDFCGVAGSQEVIRARPAEIIRPKHTKTGHVKGGFYTGWVCEEKNGPHLHTTQLSLPQILPGA